MTIKTLDIAEPFFTTRFMIDESAFMVEGRAILLNLSEQVIAIENQHLAFLQSVIVQNTPIRNIAQGVLIERFADYADEAALFEAVRKSWRLAFDVRIEERLYGVEHYLSPKARIGNIRLSMYHAASVPLNVGLHKEHPFCAVAGFREVHTQIVGFGKMQQCRSQDLSTLYMEEIMAPGQTHRPLYDDMGQYPWHQFETITPSIFMAVEILPEGYVDENAKGNGDD